LIRHPFCSRQVLDGHPCTARAEKTTRENKKGNGIDTHYHPFTLWVCFTPLSLLEGVLAWGTRFTHWNSWQMRTGFPEDKYTKHHPSHWMSVQVPLQIDSHKEASS